MKKEKQGNLRFGFGMIMAFLLWTAAVRFVDVQPIGPLGSAVGFAGLNRFVHTLTGVHMSLYVLTDWLGLVPFGVAAGFALLGLMQWIKRKQLGKVDRSIFALGGFYTAVIAVYFFFEMFAVNYRPVLIDGILEVSYPSSTTMLVMCVMPTAILQLKTRIKHESLKKWVSYAIAGFTVFVVVCRLVSGVHWFTDIVGGALLSGGLVCLYWAVTE